MAEIEIEGRTVEEAIEEGLKTLGCSRDHIEVKILNEGTAGLFGLMGAKPARVRLVSKNGAAAAAGAVDLSRACEKARAIIANILGLMHIEFSDITVTADADRVSADIHSTEGSLIIGKNGQTLEALEHIVTLMLSRDEATRTKVNLDTENYRQHQEERITAAARKAADDVLKTGKAFRFDPMPSRDRRLIHMLFKDHPEIETFSEGDGRFRKVGLRPKNS